eukprot:gene10193-biopygen7418
MDELSPIALQHLIATEANKANPVAQGATVVAAVEVGSRTPVRLAG